MAEHRLDFQQTLASIDIAPKKPRGAAVDRRFGGSKQRDLFDEVDETRRRSS
jgi:hypothetical protein